MQFHNMYLHRKTICPFLDTLLVSCWPICKQKVHIISSISAFLQPYCVVHTPTTYRPFFTPQLTVYSIYDTFARRQLYTTMAMCRMCALYTTLYSKSHTSSSNSLLFLCCRNSCNVPPSTRQIIIVNALGGKIIHSDYNKVWKLTLQTLYSYEYYMGSPHIIWFIVYEHITVHIFFKM